MESEYLIDTNIAIYFLEGRLPQTAIGPFSSALKKKPNISVISKIELLSWDDPGLGLLNFVNDCRLYSLTDELLH